MAQLAGSRRGRHRRPGRLVRSWPPASASALLPQRFPGRHLGTTGGTDSAALVDAPAPGNARHSSGRPVGQLADELADQAARRTRLGARGGLAGCAQTLAAKTVDPGAGTGRSGSNRIVISVACT